LNTPLRVRRIVAPFAASVATAGLLAMASPSFAATTTTAPKATRPSAANAPFCTQMAASQSAITAAATSSKIKITAQEWAKLDKVAPTSIKSSTTVLATAYAAAEKAHRNTVIRDAGFNSAAKTVSTFAAANCAATATAGQRGNGDDGDDDNREGGRGPGDDGDFAAIQACLKTKGVTLPARGPRGGGRPAAGNAPGTTIKGQTVPPRGEGDGPRGGPGGRPQLDAKTQKALQECFATVGRK
jgi:hypothetical protein